LAKAKARSVSGSRFCLPGQCENGVKVAAILNVLMVQLLY